MDLINIVGYTINIIDLFFMESGSKNLITHTKILYPDFMCYQIFSFFPICFSADIL